MQLVIGSTYESSRGFGRLLYLGETHDIDGYLPTFRTSTGEQKFYSYDQLPGALVEFAQETVSRADELIACLEGEIASRDIEIERVTANCNLLDDQNDQIRAELTAIKTQEPVAWTDGAGAMYSASLMASLNISSGGLTPLYAAPVSEAKAQGVVQWPEADEIMQMAFEEGQPADDASGYCFELEEFDLFIERLMSEVANLNAATVQQASVPDAGKLADAFISWKLPASVRPDGCAMDQTYPHRHGTNLLTWAQAKEMFEYVLAHHQKEHLDSVRNLKVRIADLVERLPYADGQAYYDDKRKIEAMKAELFKLESHP